MIMTRRFWILAAVLVAQVPAVLYAQQWPKRDLVLEYRVGSIDDPNFALTRVGGVLIGPRDEIIVAQPSEQLIRIFGPRGAAIKSVGRAGEGPGEFRLLGSIGLRGDTLYATDDRLRRVSWFPSGNS